MGIFNYLKESRAEMKHVNWPTRKEVLSTTITVIIISLVVAALLGFFDYGFSQALKSLVA